jgi:hemoglobin
MKWVVLVGCWLAWTATGLARADDQTAPSAEPKSGDKQLSDALRDIINQGADLYNTGDRNGCYRLFQGALMAARVQLAHYPDLQKAIDTGLADSLQQADVGNRAFVLRRVLDQVRAKVKPAGSQASDAGTLWDRLGGAETVKKVVDDFTDLAANDPKVNFSRNGKYKLDEKAVAKFKKSMVDFICSASGGPIKYAGKSMKEVHAGMDINNAEFNASAADLKKALEMNGAKPADIDELLRIVGTTRKDIVEPEKPPKK